MSHPAFVLGGLSFFLAGFFFQDAGLVLDDTAFYIRHLPTIQSWQDVFHLKGAFAEWFGFLQRPLSIATMWLDLYFRDAYWVGAHWHQAFWYGLSVSMATIMFQEALRLFRPHPNAASALGGRNSQITFVWLAGFLFAFHPSHVNAAAWLSARHDVVAGAFLFLAVALSLRALRLDSRRLHFLAAGSFFMSIHAKEMAWVVPLLMFGVATLLQKRRLNMLLAFGLAVALHRLLWVVLPSPSGIEGAAIPWHAEAFSRWVCALGWSLQHALWPTHSTLLPPNPTALGFGWTAVSIAIIVFGFCLKRFRQTKDSLPLFAFAFAVMTLGPTWMVAWKPIMVTTVAERYLLMPSAGVVLLLLSLFNGRWFIGTSMALGIVWLALLPSAAQAWVLPSPAMAIRLVAENPTSLAARMGGFARLQRAADSEAAIALAHRLPAVRPNPGEFADYHAFQSRVLALQKEWGPARNEALEAVRIYPNSSARHQELGLLCWDAFLDLADPETGYSERKWAVWAGQSLQEAIRLDSQAYQAHYVLGCTQASFGDWSHAIQSFRDTIACGRGTREGQLAKIDLESALSAQAEAAGHLAD
ncbi:MAG: hypothetical protein HOM34_05560 [Planctomycetes bacterium]|nr:hypothetical protein [Planctomycetota bacterium]MBT5101078.1 hypothetical protein [Planctomycetota bacterium]MBT5120169.1 hypothetical protein [Planctomycetota bacterium]MBT7013238.1 hypothetical protein [Planctomycetota bacterium]